MKIGDRVKVIYTEPGSDTSQYYGRTGTIVKLSFAGYHSTDPRYKDEPHNLWEVQIDEGELENWGEDIHLELLDEWNLDDELKAAIKYWKERL